MRVLQDNEFWSAAAAAFDNDALELTILPTEKCNLSCSYCYETFQLGRMAPEVVQSVENLLVRRAPDLRKLNIDWFGGEPLIALGIIERISGRAKALAEQNPYLAYSGSITTNGVLLTTAVARSLSDVGVRLMHVSLDGPAMTHDQTRVGRDGRGTFADLERNLLGIRDSDIDVQIELRIHVTPLNYSLLDGFLDYLAEKLLFDPRFNAYFFPIVDLGGPKQKSLRILTQDEAALAVDRLTQRVRDLKASMPAAQTGAAGRKKGCKSPYVCYAAKPNAWVIRSNGRLSKCTVGFEDERNDVGRLTPEGNLEIRNGSVRVWMRGWETGDKMSLHCPYEGMREDVKSGAVEARG